MRHAAVHSACVPNRSASCLSRSLPALGSQASTSAGASLARLRFSKASKRSRVRDLTPLAAFKPTPQEPLGASLVSRILKTSNVPYSSYIPEPRGLLHSISAEVKQIWLVAILLFMFKATALMQLCFTAACAVLTVLALPPRLWKPQLKRLTLLALWIFVSIALSSDGVPAMTQMRHPSAALQGLPDLPQPAHSYRYVLLNLTLVTVTRRSVRLAITSACLTFVALQSSNLVLTCTPPEELATGLRTLLRPLAFLKVPVNEIGLTSLLALRFMSQVFEETRNLCLGLAARGIDWNSLGPTGGIQILLKLLNHLFSNLLQRSDSIAQAMCARGFVGAESHKLYLTNTQPTSRRLDILAMSLLVVVAVAINVSPF